jgi:hypothetical protein
MAAGRVARLILGVFCVVILCAWLPYMFYVGPADAGQQPTKVNIPFLIEGLWGAVTGIAVCGFAHRWRDSELCRHPLSPIVVSPVVAISSLLLSSGLWLWCDPGTFVSGAPLFVRAFSVCFILLLMILPGSAIFTGVPAVLSSAAIVCFLRALPRSQNRT